ncbi:MAG: hypothetical protein AAB656_02890 [Patescibacteria group bacterium]
MEIIAKNQLQERHLHAYTEYADTSLRHYLKLALSIVVCICIRAKSVTVHLPLELQHPKVYKNLDRGSHFIDFGEFLKKTFGINLYWENAPLLNYGTWNLKFGQTEWIRISKKIDICLDTGHLILGAKSATLARKRILKVITERGNQIKHLHISENDFVYDQHKRPKKIITKKLLKVITKNRTFIYER